MPKIWLPNKVAQEYFSRRQAVGNDPYPDPQSEREEIVHQLWQLRVSVAGWWLEETSVLRDILQKQLEAVPQEALRMQAEAEERERRRATGPIRAQISAGLRDVYSFNKAKRDGRRRLYPASGVEALNE